MTHVAAIKLRRDVPQRIREERMRILDKDTRRQVQAFIDANRDQFAAVPGFVSAEPGFPLIDGAIRKEPAIIVFVAQKKPPTHLLPEERVPRQIGPYRVCVMQADPLRQIQNLMGDSPIADALADSASGLTYERVAGDPITLLPSTTMPLLWTLPCVRNTVSLNPASTSLRILSAAPLLPTMILTSRSARLLISASVASMSVKSLSFSFLRRAGIDARHVACDDGSARDAEDSVADRDATCPLKEL
jgi:hypothetical protein